MTLLFVDGFDHYATADITKKWTTAGSGGSSQISASGGRRGGGAFYAATSSAYITKTLPSTYSTLICGFAFMPGVSGGTNVTIAQIREGATYHFTLNLNGSNKLEVKRGTWSGAILGAGATALSTGVFYYIEIKLVIHDTTGAVTLRINGVNDLVLTNVDTRNGGTGVADILNLGDPATFAAATSYYDDLYICNTSGSTNNDFLGDIRVDTLFPTSDGNYSQFTPSTGTTHYVLVDENPVNASDYVDGATVGDRDSYGMGNLSAIASSTVYGVQVSAALQKDDAGAKSASTFVRSASTDSDGASAPLGTSQGFVSQVYETDPAAAAWTETTVNGMEAGVKVTA